MGTACDGSDPASAGSAEISAPGKADDSTAGRHYEAMNHEIFIDKITPCEGSHALRRMSIFVKTLNSRLDGPIAEVGFRNKRTGVEYYGKKSLDRDWTNDKLGAFTGAEDYWVIGLELSCDFYLQQFEGVFYVKTTNNTFYWAKAPDHQNFILDLDGWNSVMGAKGVDHNYSCSESEAVPTQQPSMEYYNWHQSR